MLTISCLCYLLKTKFAIIDSAIQETIFLPKINKIVGNVIENDILN